LNCVALFDPSVRVLGIDDSPVIESLDADIPVPLRREGAMRQIQKVNGAAVGMFAFTIKLNSNDRIRHIKTLKARLRALRSVQDVERALEAPDFATGEGIGDEQLKLSAIAGQRPGSIQVAISGQAMKGMTQAPWSDLFWQGRLRVLDARGQPIQNITFIMEKPQDDRVLMSIQPEERDNKRQLALEIDRIEVSVPQKATYIDIPLLLQDIEMP
jgi:hypothetical protein